MKSPFILRPDVNRPVYAAMRLRLPLAFAFYPPCIGVLIGFV